MITDGFGGTATATVTVSVTKQVLEQQPGKVTAGGAQLDKKTNFGFNVKSDDKKIKGEMEYQDKTANINLHSIKMTSLSIAPSKINAVFTGTGTINHVSGYTFEVYVEDNGEPGKTDYFSIKIKDSSGTITYTKAGILTKGNIQIHNVSDKDD